LAIRQTATTTEKSRGRLETRTVTTTTNVIDEGYLNWPGAKQIIRLERRTVIKGKVTSSTTYAITSLPRAKADAGFLLKHLRGRWLIESRFYILDTQLGEDHCRARTGGTAHGLSAIRHFAVNLAGILRRSTTHMCQEHAAKPNVLLHRLRIPTY
jgi:predicted transposase YbfD/YdcC